MMVSRSLSANALAKASGVNRQVITNILHGSVWPDSLTIMDLEDALAAEIWPAQVGSLRAAVLDDSWGMSADERVLGRIVLEAKLLRRMTVEYATILHWHVARFHVAAVADMLREIADADVAEHGSVESDPALTVGRLATMRLDEWLAHHATALSQGRPNRTADIPTHAAPV
ncbi:hypothetical protein ACFVV7_26730 [Streptomyces globisporus]|uniref:hypothetical protein n=1 Tax=Streptomyces globisporus TaxID=1908 RepID=UPI0036D80B9D